MLSCQLETCNDGTGEYVRSARKPVPGGTVVGQNVDVEIPPTSHPVYQTSDKTFSAQCVDNGNGAVYQPENEINVSCSAFPCPDTRIQHL